MKKNNRNTKIGIAAFFSISLLIMGCYEFDFVIQPYNANPNSSFNVQISAITTDGDSTEYYWSYFMVKLPVGWAVVDSIPYINPVQNGLYIYSDALTQELTNQHPPLYNYVWHVFKSSEQILYFAGDNFQFEPIIVTDNQHGFFSIDYHLGDSQCEISDFRTSSTDHLISVGYPEHIVVTNTNDSGPGSLRSAIDSVGISGTITFDLGQSDSIVLEDQIEIYKNVHITDTNDISLNISGNNNCRIFYIHENRRLSISNLSIVNGYADYAWGGGGGIFIDENATLIAMDVTIANNIAENNGGGIASAENSIIKLTNVSLLNNYSFGRGGGIYSKSSNTILKSTLILGNEALYGGGTYFKNSNPILINVTISENSTPLTSGYGAGIYCYDYSHLILINTIIWDNSPQNIYLLNSSITISYSDIQYGESCIGGVVNWLEGNINEDPLFVDVGDFLFQINDYSPCIDGGAPDTTGLSLPEYDLAGNPRIVNNRIDMGAYEWNIMVDVEEQVITEPSKAKINIYPNPVKNNATISYNSKQHELVKIQLYNSSGICVKFMNVNNPISGEQNLIINTNNLLPGIYFLHLQTGHKVMTKKIIKVN